MGSPPRDERIPARLPGFLPTALERELAASIDRVSEAILVTRSNLDAPGPTIVAASEGACAMTGYSRAELVGANPRILQGPLTDRDVLARLRETCARGERFFGEAVNYRKDGGTFILQWAIAPLRNGDGHVTHFISLQRDITHLRDFAASWLEAEQRTAEAFAVSNAQLAAITEAILVLAKPESAARAGELGRLREQLIEVAGRSPAGTRQDGRA